MNPRIRTETRRSRWCAAGALLIGVAVVTAAPAQSVSRSYTRYCGNSTVGSKLYSYGNLYRSSSLVRAQGKLIGSARLFGGTYEGARVEGLSQLQGASNLHRATVKIAGYTVYDISRSYGWSWDWSYSRTFFEKDRTFFLAGIPVNCEVRVGGTVFADLNLGAGTYARMTGRLGSNAWGSAGVGVDLIAFRAGVRADITVFDNWLQASLTARTTGISGSLRYVSDPLRMLLKLFLDQAYIKVSWSGVSRRWREIASMTLVSWSANGTGYTFLSY